MALALVTHCASYHATITGTFMKSGAQQSVGPGGTITPKLIGGKPMR